MAVACQIGHENIDGAFFCEQCGERLASGAVADIPASVGANGKAGGTQPRLVIVATGVVLDFGGKDSVLLGRSDPNSDLYPDIDFTLHGGEDGGVSRRHAFVRRVRDHYVIEDQQSVNKTFLNKQRLEAFKPTKLKHGDEVRLGKLLLRFETD